MRRDHLVAFAPRDRPVTDAGRRQVHLLPRGTAPRLEANVDAATDVERQSEPTLRSANATTTVAVLV
jgi:hypothetical protein